MKLKKLLALLLALAMVFAMAACGGGSNNDDDDDDSSKKAKTGLEDRWEWVVELDGEMMGIEDFDGSLKMVVEFEFDDGAYKLTVDEDALEDTIADFEEDLVDYMIDMIYESAADEGMSRAEADEQFEEGLGMDISEYATSMVEEMDMLGTVMELDLEEEGEYRVDDDQLYMTPDGGEETVFTFELKSNKLTLSGDISGFEEILEMTGEDTIVLKRVS